MKKIYKVLVFGSLMLASLVGCKETETNSETNSSSTTENTNETKKETKLTEISLDSISVKKTYTYGEALDLTGLIVNANYDDNTSKAVTSYTTNPTNGSTLNNVGSVPVTVTYEGKTASFDVTVSKSFNNITLDTTNVKTNYEYGEALDLTGLVVTANYNNNTSETVSDYTVSPSNGAALNSVGDVEVIVTYNGDTAKFKVNVIKVLTKIEINTDNVKKEYNHHETLSLNGLVVTAYYSDNTTEDVTNFTTNPIDGAKLDSVGKKTIAITYGTKTKTFDVNVNAVLENITLDSSNVKQSYKHKETLDLTGLIVFANYSDGSKKEVNDYITDPTNGTVLNNVGNNRINVTYQGKTTFFDINVDKTLVRITLDTTNVKTTYRHGEHIDLTGLVVTAVYSDNSTENVSEYVKTNVPDGYTFEVFNNLQVEVEYSGVSAKFTCNCPPFNEEGTTVTIDLDRDLTFGGMGTPNNALLSGIGTKGSSFMPTMSLYQRSSAQGSMTHVNGTTRFLQGDSIENVTEIGGITKITVNGGDGNYNLSVGYSQDNLHNFLTGESVGGTRIFDNIPNVNYFRLVGKYDSHAADISSIVIEYTRDESHKMVSGVAKTIEQVDVVNGTYLYGSKTIVVNGNKVSANGDEYTFVGIEYKGSILYKNSTDNGLLIKFKNNTEIEVRDISDAYGGFSGNYSMSIPATSVTINVNGTAATETSATNRVDMNVGDSFTISATCNAVPSEIPSISLVDESNNGVQDAYVGTYTPLREIDVTDYYYSYPDFELLMNPIVVTKVGDNYSVSYSDADSTDYTSHSGTYAPNVNGGSIKFGASDGFSVEIDTSTKKINFEYYNESEMVYFVGSIGYTFETSNKPTATLNNGVVTAVNGGDFYIKAVTSNGIETKYYVHVADYIAANITLANVSKTINTGETYQIEASVNKDATNGEIAYSSSNTDVAIVDSKGVVTAVSAGNATITITTADDSKTVAITVKGSVVIPSVTYTFIDEDTVDHELVVYEGQRAVLDSIYTFTYSNGYYYYDEDNSCYFGIRQGAMLDYYDSNMVLFGYDGNVVTTYDYSGEGTIYID